MAGYGGDFSTSGAQTVIGQAEVSYLPSEGNRVALGYLRTLQPVPVFGTYGDDRGYLQAHLGLLGGRLGLTGTLQADYFSFYRGANRNDFNLSAGVQLDFDVTSWFAVSGGYTLGYRSSQGQPQAVNFTRHEGLLRLTLRY